MQKTGEIWPSIEGVGSMCFKNISDLVLKEIYGICETKNPTKEQIKERNITEREIFKNFDNLSEDELNTKCNRNSYARNDVITTIIKRCRGEKKRSIRAIDRFRKKLITTDSKILKCPEFEVKSEIGKLFMNEKIFEEYSVKVYKIDLYFYEHHKKKKVYKNGCGYISFRIDVYFTEYLLAAEIDEKNHERR